jgi:hypothetical protein
MERELSSPEHRKKAWFYQAVSGELSSRSIFEMAFRMVPCLPCGRVRQTLGHFAKIQIADRI